MILAKARIYAVGLALTFAGIACGLTAISWFYPAAAASRAAAFATVVSGVASQEEAGRAIVGTFLRLLPGVAIVAVIAAVLLRVATSYHRTARLAASLLFLLIVGDLLGHARGVNPVFDAAYLAEPQWLALTKRDLHSRFYVGGKRDGTLDIWDLDASLAFFNPPGLTGSASRAALSAQAAFYPSAWRSREMLSYDLAVLWPRTFHRATARFVEADRDERSRFLRPYRRSIPSAA